MEVADTGFGMEVADNGFGMEVADTGFGMEVADNGFGMEVADTGFGMEVADTGFGMEVADTGFGMEVADTGFGMEVADTGFGMEVADTGFGMEVADPGFGMEVADTGFGMEVTGALINAALKKAGVNVASIQDIKNLKSRGFRPFHAAGNDSDEETGWTSEHDVVGGAPSDDSTATTESDDSGHFNTKYDFDIKKATASGDFLQKVSSVNKNGMNLLASGFLCLGVLLLIANFMKSPEVALVSVAVCVAVAISALVLLVGVVGECAKNRDTCLLSKLDWFTNFIVTLFWFMYIFCWLFFAGVANAFANGMY